MGKFIFIVYNKHKTYTMDGGNIMALINCDFFSNVLGVSTSITVILPQDTSKQIGMNGSVKKDKYPTLYLLHGLSDDHTTWQRRTSIERYVAEMGIAVVMPNADTSFYTDMKYGKDYFTFISKELPEICRSFFPLSEKREDNFVAGLSMGGYGAFKVALSHPNSFCAAASLSGALDMAGVLRSKDEDYFNGALRSIFGGTKNIENTKDDLLYLVKNLESKDNKPRLYQCCGTEDFLYEDNIRFRDFIDNKNFDYTYEECSGSHSWQFWDDKIQTVLKWLEK